LEKKKFRTVISPIRFQKELISFSSLFLRVLSHPCYCSVTANPGATPPMVSGREKPMSAKRTTVLLAVFYWASGTARLHGHFFPFAVMYQFRPKTTQDQLFQTERAFLQQKNVGFPRWRIEGGSRKRASYSEILERHRRHTLQA
jgi:hypothetical protein